MKINPNWFQYVLFSSYFYYKKVTTSNILLLKFIGPTWTQLLDIAVIYVEHLIKKQVFNKRKNFFIVEYLPLYVIET